MNPEHLKQSRKVFLKERLSPVNLILSIWATLILLATIFSLPFPFSRQIWIKEVLGITGILHAILFVLIGREIERKGSLPAALAGVGIVLNEQILAWRGFLGLSAHEAVRKSHLLFLGFSVVASIVLLGILASALRAGLSFRRFRGEHDSELGLPQEKVLGGLALLFLNVAVYASFFTILRGAVSLEENLEYIVLKVAATLASTFSLFSTGLELNFYLSQGQSKFECSLKILAHLLSLAAILWVIYRILPIEGRLFLN